MRDPTLATDLRSPVLAIPTPVAPHAALYRSPVVASRRGAAKGGSLTVIAVPKVPARFSGAGTLSAGPGSRSELSQVFSEAMAEAAALRRARSGGFLGGHLHRSDPPPLSRPPGC